VGLPAALFHIDGYEFYGQINCMKAGILGSDRVTTVSRTYAREILTPEFGCHLEGFLAAHAGKLSGIVNGLDTDKWNPATDLAIAANFRAGNLRGKHRCKRALRQELGLPEQASVPLLTFISRLVEQKGVDLLIDCIPLWLEAGYQLVVLGSGEPAYESILHDLATASPRQLHFHAGFNETLARKIYAGGDIFLMPSRFEPCGLGQLMAMRYGNIPVVRATGGLKDTVVDYPSMRAEGTGFTFTEADPASLRRAVQRAASTWRKPAVWRRIVGRAMRHDSSWRASAAAYARLYRTLL